MKVRTPDLNTIIVTLSTGVEIGFISQLNNPVVLKTSQNIYFNYETDSFKTRRDIRALLLEMGSSYEDSFHISEKEMERFIADLKI